MDIDKNLPLHMAIDNGHFEMTRFCVERAKQTGDELIG